MPGVGCEEGAIRLLEVQNKFKGRHLWRCVKEENGRRRVIADGTTRKQEWYADNWGLLKIQEVIIS